MQRKIQLATEWEAEQLSKDMASHHAVSQQHKLMSEGCSLREYMHADIDMLYHILIERCM